MSQDSGAPTARPPRTTGGLIGALVVTLVAIGAFVAFRALNRNDLEVRPAAVDYLSVVEQAQTGGYELVYPASLPEGWTATTVDLVPGDRPAWFLGIHTDEGRFVGVRQADESMSDLLAAYVDAETTDEKSVQVSGSVAREWRGFADDGGDHAYGAEVGEESVLVYGSAPTEDLVLLLGLLTTDPR